MNRLRVPRAALTPLALLAAVWVVFGVRNDVFLTTGNVYSVLAACSLLALVAVGLGITMLAGEADLSGAAIAGLAGVMAVRLAEIGVVPAILLTTVVLAIFGLLQGYLINRTGVDSLVFTVGSLILISGLANVASGNTSISLPIEYFDVSQAINQEILGVLSPFVLIVLGLALISWAVLSYSRFGRELYALGGGRTEAMAAGVKLRPKMLAVFAVSAGFAALAGSLSAVGAGGAMPGGAETLLLAAITAVLIGGVSLSGGVGSVIGVVVGAIVIQSIAAGVAIEGADNSVTNYLTAGLLFLVLAFEGLAKWRSARRAARNTHRGLTEISDSGT